MLLAFMAAALQGLIRGLDFDCGCFGPADGRTPGVGFFLRDGALFLIAVALWRVDRHPSRERSPSRERPSSRKPPSSGDPDPAGSPAPS